jgi:hypothetical protein
VPTRVGLSVPAFYFGQKKPEIKELHYNPSRRDSFEENGDFVKLRI